MPTTDLVYELQWDLIGMIFIFHFLKTLFLTCDDDTCYTLFIQQCWFLKREHTTLHDEFL